jgi:hypothetical protein
MLRVMHSVSERRHGCRARSWWDVTHSISGVEPSWCGWYPTHSDCACCIRRRSAVRDVEVTRAQCLEAFRPSQGDGIGVRADASVASARLLCQFSSQAATDVLDGCRR